MKVKKTRIENEVQIVSEVRRRSDFLQWKLIRDGGQISKENLYKIQYYKEIFMSNDKLLIFQIAIYCIVVLMGRVC